MTVLRIEHPVADYPSWKTAFDGDPIGRVAGGVRAHRILRPVDDPRFVLIDLEFDDRAHAEAFRDALVELWRTPAAAAAYQGTPVARVLEATETVAS